ncbi:hypothetical protein ACFE04_012754 [Oxalis oulophora]
MREEEESSNWFNKWEQELPSPQDLMPLTQTLISSDLALAFDIPNHHHQLTPHLPPSATPHSQPTDFAADSGELGAGDDQARTKRPRLVWTPQLHKRFVDAVAHLGIKNAVPKTIMQLMSVDGLTRENVASHLQKYRLYLKRMQNLSNGGVGNNGISGGGVGDSATDRLFASQPVPAHFLHSVGRQNSEHFMPFVPIALQQHQITAAVVAQHHTQLQGQYHRQVPHFGGSPPNGGFEHPFLARQTQQPLHRVGIHVHNAEHNYVEEGNENGETKVLTLFPTGDESDAVNVQNWNLLGRDTLLMGLEQHQ